MEAEKTIVFRVDGELRKDTKIFNLVSYDPLDQIIICDRGYSFFLFKKVYKLKKEKNLNLEISFNLDLKSNLNIIPKWKNILTSDPTRSEQLEFLETTIKLKGSQAQIPTGFGKTEMFLGLTESYLTRDKKSNVLILVQKNSIRDTIILRLKKYNLYENPRIKVLNPIGFLRSKQVHEEEMIQWFKKVRMVITDEVHHIPANSYRKLFDLCPSIEYSYGFSATISVKEDLLDYSKFDQWDSDVRKSVGMTGPCSVNKTPKDLGRKIKYLSCKGNFGSPKKIRKRNFGSLETTKRVHFVTHVRAQCFNFQFKEFVKTCIETYSKNDRIFFIPIPIIDAGREIHEYLMENGIESIHWAEGKFNCSSEIDSYEDLRTEMQTGKYKAIIGTSSCNEGVDIPSISAVILAFGKDEKLPIQTSGRASRGSRPAFVINVFNQSSTVLLSQAEAREESLKRFYDIKINEWNYSMETNY